MSLPCAGVAVVNDEGEIAHDELNRILVSNAHGMKEVLGYIPLVYRVFVAIVGDAKKSRGSRNGTNLASAAPLSLTTPFRSILCTLDLSPQTCCQQRQQPIWTVVLALKFLRTVRTRQTSTTLRG
jgi:hypothetical protein